MKSVLEISERFYNHQQSWNYDRIVVVNNDVRLRIKIRRNSYDEQSEIVGYALDETHRKWNQLVWRPIAGAACFDASYSRDNESVNPFRKDAQSVLVELLAILNIK